MTTVAHKFTTEQINKIAALLSLPVENIKRLEEDENLEIEVQGATDKLLIYVSADAETNVVTVDVFLDDNDLDNEEAYQGSFDNCDEESGNLESAIDIVIKEFIEEYVGVTE